MDLCWALATLRHAPPPAVLAADAFVGGRAGYLFGMDAASADASLQSGVFAAPEDAEWCAVISEPRPRFG